MLRVRAGFVAIAVSVFAGVLLLVLLLSDRVGRAEVVPVESSFTAVSPSRVLDTRDPLNVGLAGPFESPNSQKLQLTGVIPTSSGNVQVVPQGATGVTLNVTVVNPTAPGFVSIRPGDAQGAPTTSSLNFVGGQTVPNSVTVALPVDGGNKGMIDITYDAYGVNGQKTEILIDVVGFNTPLVGGGGNLGGIQAQLDALSAKVDAQAAQIQVLETKLASVTIEVVDDQPTVRFSGVNVQIVDGSGTTGGPTNGRGNLIVGYNEDNFSDRTGSHNLVVGQGNSYTSFGGVVFGQNNRIDAQFAAVTGGSFNEVTGNGGSVSGGIYNDVNGSHGSVLGGKFNDANGSMSTVVGGQSNVAGGVWSTVAGGVDNQATNDNATASGGTLNTASGPNSFVAGGRANTASGGDAVALGGVSNLSSGNRSTAVGGDNLICNSLNPLTCMDGQFIND